MYAQRAFLPTISLLLSTSLFAGEYKLGRRTVTTREFVNENGIPTFEISYDYAGMEKFDYTQSNRRTLHFPADSHKTWPKIGYRGGGLTSLNDIPRVGIRVVVEKEFRAFVEKHKIPFPKEYVHPYWILDRPYRQKYKDIGYNADYESFFHIDDLFEFNAAVRNGEVLPAQDTIFEYSVPNGRPVLYAVHASRRWDNERKSARKAIESIAKEFDRYGLPIIRLVSGYDRLAGRFAQYAQSENTITLLAPHGIHNLKIGVPNITIVGFWTTMCVQNAIEHAYESYMRDSEVKPSDEVEALRFHIQTDSIGDQTQNFAEEIAEKGEKQAITDFVKMLGYSGLRDARIYVHLDGSYMPEYSNRKRTPPKAKLALHFWHEKPHPIFRARAGSEWR